MTVHEQRPTSRTEKQVRNQGRVLFWTGVTLLGACMAMTAMFGVSYGRSVGEKALLAAALAGSDIAGSAFAASSATYFAARARLASVGALLVAAVCFAVTLTGIIGFQADNREASAQKRERDAKLDADQLDWLRHQTTSSGKGNEKQIMLGEVKQQLSALKAADGTLPDAFSSIVAPIFGIKEGESRRYSVVMISVALLIVQYACLWFYGFTRQRIEPMMAASNGLPLSQLTRQSNGKPAFSEADARDDLSRLLAANYRIDNISFLARRWAWTNHRTRRWLEKQPDLDLPPKGKRGGGRVTIALNPALNGNGRAHA